RGLGITKENGAHDAATFSVERLKTRRECAAIGVHRGVGKSKFLEQLSRFTVIAVEVCGHGAIAIEFADESTKERLSVRRRGRQKFHETADAVNVFPAVRS